MQHSVHLRPDELSSLIVEAAVTADQEGFWDGARPIADDAVEHLVRFLGVLLAGDDDVSLHELTVFGDVFAAASGEAPSRDEMREAAMRAVEIASDPDALHAFLGSTPAYLQAVLAMDRERGTRNSDQVVTALSGLALAVLAADGRSEPEEESVFTIHVNHLRGEVETLERGPVP